MTTGCEDRAVLLSRYLDGELPAEEASALEKHLEACAECGKDLDSFRLLSRVLSVRTEPDPSFVARFRARRNGSLWIEAAWLSWKRLTVRLLPLAAAALLGATAAVWLSLERKGLVELEAGALGTGFSLPSVEEPYPALQIALEPFPEAEQ